MNKKGKSIWAEFLWTYGWAILVILIAMGALAYFGILNPGKYKSHEKAEQINTINIPENYSVCFFTDSNDYYCFNGKKQLFNMETGEIINLSKTNLSFVMYKGVKE